MEKEIDSEISEIDIKEIEKKLKEEVLKAELEFAPHNEGDMATNIYQTIRETIEMQEAEEEAAVLRANFFEEDEEKAKPEEDVPVIPVEFEMPVQKEVKPQSEVQPQPTPKKDVDAMETVILPNEEIEDDESPTGKIVRNVLIGCIAVVALVIILFLILSHVLFGSDDETSKQEQSSTVSSEEIFTGKEMTGVIVALDSEKETAAVHAAGAKDNIVFDLEGVERITDAYGNAIGFSSLKVGQVVDVSYQEGSVNKVERFRLSSVAVEVADVYGVQVDAADHLIKAGGKIYQFGDELICTYGGKELSPSEITQQFVMNLLVVDEYVYTISVMQAVGTVTLTNAENYEGAKITFTPNVGDPVEATIVKNLKPIVLTEGFNKYKVERDGVTLASGTIFVEANLRQELSLPSISENEGVVDVSILPEDAEVKILLDGKEQKETTLTIPYGEHVLQITGEGFEPYNQKFEVSQPYMQMTVTLVSTQISVFITSSTDGVVIYCNGDYIATYEGTAVEVKLEKGEYYFMLAKEGYEPEGCDITVDENSPKELTLYFPMDLVQPEEESSVEESSEEESSEEESSVEESSEEESSVEESSEEESSVEESSEEESSVEESSEEESSVEESSVEESSVEESSVEESSVEESSVEESSVEESSVEESSVEESSAEESSVEESSAAQESSVE